MIILTAMFTLIPAPVVAHRVGQLAYREQNIRDDLLTLDEMREMREYTKGTQDNPTEG
jgi:multicomponent Na+:H+ antiporter subunit G